MNPVQIPIHPLPPVDDTEIHQLEYVDRDNWSTVCIGEFKRIHEISEVKPGDKIVSTNIIGAKENKFVLMEIERIRGTHLKMKSRDGFYAFWNCYLMVNP